MLKGVLLKRYGGFYYVQVRETVWECSLRGRFRVQEQDFLPGDYVSILPNQDGKATIEKVWPRKNELSRPAVANVEQVVLVFSLAEPSPDTILLDRLLLQVHFAGLKTALIFTKADLLEHQAAEGQGAAPGDPDRRPNPGSDLPEVYRRIGIPVLVVSNKTGERRGQAADLLDGKISVLAGPSGAGKSSFLNSLNPDLYLKTGRVSAKTGRGRHTTRHVELLPVAGGLVADTPGFSSLFLPPMEREDLQTAFPEFTPYLSQCRFAGCGHDKEPQCAVRAAAADGKIWPERYEHYLVFLQEIKGRKKH